MRLFIPCMKCCLDNGKPNNQFNHTEFNDNGSYKLTCSSGHETTTVLSEQKFQILYEIGSHAILDGYYREAVSSFTSSLERFYEFSIKVLLVNKPGFGDFFVNSWKKVSNQSERQLGAFIFLWSSELNECPDLIPQKLVEFRNAVIHKGKIPTRDEAINYGDAVLSDINKKLQGLNQKFPEQIRKVVLLGIIEGYPKESLNDKQPGDIEHTVSTMYVPTILRIDQSNQSHLMMNLTEHLQSLSERRKSLYI